jgi:uncharacterized membrane protein YphA (DoxX/SURF4 family)
LSSVRAQATTGDEGRAHEARVTWFGQHPAGTEGYEYQLLALGVALAVILMGAGKWSLDGALTR